MNLYTSYQQVHDHTCGACVVQDLMAHFGLHVPSEMWLARRLKATFKYGIEPERIVEFFNALHCRATLHHNGTIAALRRALDRGMHPIIITQDWGGHYSSVDWICTEAEAADITDKAYSEGIIHLADPAASYDGSHDGFTTMSVARFKAIWYDVDHAQIDANGKYVETRGPYILVRPPKTKESKP